MMFYETQRRYTCPNQCQLCDVSLNVIIIVSDIKMKRHIKYENV